MSAITGNDLADRLEIAARQAGQDVAHYLLPLTPHPWRWINQLRIAKTPKPATIERVEALIIGAPVPPAPANNFQKSRQQERPCINVGAAPMTLVEAEPIDRDPCFRCGVRGDLGCEHRAAWS